MKARHAKRLVAAVRTLRRVRWIWLAPAAAAAIVLYLGWQTIVERGPLVTITFQSADGIVAGQTKIKHRNVDIGVVESVALSPDMSWTIVKARMNRQVEPYLNSGTHFWIVRPRVTAAGISGLTTILSGSYIEMDPGNGTPEKEFKGFDEDAAMVKPTEPGRDFTLVTSQLGAIAKESKVTYHGIAVGQVLGYQARSGRPEYRDHHPYFRALRQSRHRPDPLLERERHRSSGRSGRGSRSAAAGWRICSRAAAVAFDTWPAGGAAGAPGKAGSTFPLYDNEKDARAGKTP